jgi:hypothetical protein
MFDRWGRGIYRARRLTLVIAVLFAIAGGAGGTGVFSRLDARQPRTRPGRPGQAESIGHRRVRQPQGRARAWGGTGWL